MFVENSDKSSVKKIIKGKSFYSKLLEHNEQIEYEAEEQLKVENLYYKLGYSDGSNNYPFKSSIEFIHLGIAKDFGMYIDGYNDGKKVYREKQDAEKNKTD